MYRLLVVVVVVGWLFVGCGGDSDDAMVDLGTTTSTVAPTAAPSSDSTPEPAEDLKPAEDTRDDVAAFIAAAEAICAPANEQLLALDATLLDADTTAQELGVIMRQDVAVAEQMNEDLRELSPPEELRESWELWLESRVQGNAAQKDLVEAMAAGDDEEMLERLGPLDLMTADLKRLDEGLGALGFEDCGQVALMGLR